MENKLLKVLKPTVKILTLISIAIGLLAVAILVLYNFSDILTIYTDDGTKYADGFSYPGYQTIFAGFGNMIIQGYRNNIQYLDILRMLLTINWLYRR